LSVSAQKKTTVCIFLISKVFQEVTPGSLRTKSRKSKNDSKRREGEPGTKTK